MESKKEKRKEKEESRKPRDLPGLYFDTERNRYFPVKKHGPSGTSTGPGPPPKVPQEKEKHEGDVHNSAKGGESSCKSIIVHCQGCGCGNSAGGFAAATAYHNHWKEKKQVLVKPSVKMLVTTRELTGSHSSRRGCSDGPRSFQRRVMEAAAERPMVWGDEGYLKCSASALVDVPLVVGSNEGEWRGSGLLIGGPYGELTCIGVSAGEACEGDGGSNDGEGSDGDTGFSSNRKADGPPLRASRSLFRWTFGSSITALRRWWVTSPVEQQRVIGSSMGCGDVPARLFVIQVDAAYQPSPDMQVIMGLYVYQFVKQTLWTVEASPNGSDVAIGTSNSAEIFNVDTKSRTSIIKNSSAVLSQQFTNDGQVLLCGLRNGVISTVDRREAPPGSSQSAAGPWGSLDSDVLSSAPVWQVRGSSSSGGRPSYGSSSRRSWGRGRESQRGRGKERERDRESEMQGREGAGRGRGRAMDRSLQFRHNMQRQQYGNSKRFRPSENEVHSSHTPVMRMGSAVCSLKLLRSCDHYLLASAMDSSISQWDRRMAKKPVREFEGHVNNHLMLQIDIDPTETMLISGSQDGMVRIWSLTSGKILHVAKGFSAPVGALSWAALKDMETDVRWGHGEQWQGMNVGQPNLWGLWMGSLDGVKYMGGGGPSCWRRQW